MPPRAAFGLRGFFACNRGLIFPVLIVTSVLVIIAPLPPMLMFDRITEIDDTGGAFGKGHLVAEFNIRPDLWFFESHFQCNTQIPSTVWWRILCFKPIFVRTLLLVDSCTKISQGSFRGGFVMKPL